MNDSKPSLRVKFRFEGDPKANVAILTYEQYSNIKELPITVECKIVKNQKLTLSKKDVEIINKKLELAFAKSTHTKSLLE